MPKRISRRKARARANEAAVVATTKNRKERELWKCRGCGKRGKPKAGLPLFPRAPWKTRQRRARFPHSHSAGDEGGWKSGKPKAGFPLSHRPEDRLGKNQQKTKAGGLRPLPAKAYQTSRKETSPSNLDDPIFRLMPHWNRRVLSGSSPIGINSRFQAHLWIGKCCNVEMVFHISRGYWEAGHIQLTALPANRRAISFRQPSSARTAPAVTTRGELSLVCLAFTARTCARNLDWQDDRSLWTSAMDVSPESARPHYNLAIELERIPDRLPEAIAEYQAAVRIRPDLAAVHYNLANALAQTPGCLPEAIAEYEAGLRTRPDPRMRQLVDQLRARQQQAEHFR